MLSLPEVLPVINQYSGKFTTSDDFLTKQLSSAKNYVASLDLKRWTFGKSVYYSVDFAPGGAAKKRLYQLGFVDVLKLPDGSFRKGVVNSFLNWAKDVKGSDVSGKFEKDQSSEGGKRFELLIHESVIPAKFTSAVKSEQKVMNVTVKYSLSKPGAEKVSNANLATDNEKETSEGFKREIVREESVRNQTIVKRAKLLLGTKCSVCGFSFETNYGKHGAGFIEMHHLHSIAKGQRTTKVEDLRPVCSNCHRMLHRGSDIMSIEALKIIMKEAKKYKKKS